MLKKISIISIVLLVVVLPLYLFPFFNHNIPYIEAEEFDLQIEYVENIYTRAELKSMVDALFGNPRYIYREREELRYGAIGLSCYYFSVVHIRADTPDYLYPIVLAHELVHIVYYTANERFCNIKAFELLYNSGNEFLRYSALEHLASSWSMELQNGACEYSFAGNVKV